MAKTERPRGPRGGPRPGAGRPFGTKNPETLAREAAAELQRQGVARDEQGVTVLTQLMKAFVNLTVKYNPLDPGNPNQNEDKFEKWATLAMEAATRKAPYESYKFKAVAHTLQPEGGVAPPPPKVIDGKVVTTPEEAYRLLLAAPKGQVVELKPQRKRA